MSHPPHNPLAPHHEEVAVPQVSALEAFLDKHFRNIVIICIAAIAASAIFGLLKHRNHLAAVDAATAATAAKTVDDCDVVIQKYKGSVAAGNALLTKAKLLWDQNKKDPAVVALRDFVGNYPDHPFHVQGMLSLASRLESLGGKDSAEAKSLFEKIVKEHKDSEIAGLAQIRVADLLWAEGKEADAKKIYDELPRQFIGQFADRVAERTDWIGAALPTKEVDAPKIPDALKAPAPAPGSAPAINLTPGANGSPFGKSMPFEVKAQPGGAAPQVKLGGPDSQPAVKINPPTPSPAAATSAPVAVPPLPTKAPAAPATTTPPAPAPAPSPAPAKPTEPAKK